MREDEFTTADKVAMRAIECGLPIAPWQFDFLAAIYTAQPDLEADS